MSNVLIGIIGVILFIGLALAGALFLGPRFQESTNNSRASAAVQAVSQVSSAANMYRVQEGRGAADVTTLQTSGYLKSVPSNPTGGTAPALTGTANDTVGRYATMVLAGNSAAICEAINKQSGIADADTNTDGFQFPTAAAGTQGCFSANGTSDFTAFSSI